MGSKRNRDVQEESEVLGCRKAWIVSVAVCVFLLSAFITYLVYDGSERQMTWRENLMERFWRREEEETTLLTKTKKMVSTFSYYFTSAVYYTIQYIHDKPSHPDPAKSSVQILLGLILLTLAFLWLFYYVKNQRKKHIFRRDYYEKQQIKRSWRLLKKYLLMLFILAMLISIPWEYIRLYQIEVSKKAAVTVRGMPPECQPERMSIWVTIKAWLAEHFSWSESPCEKYHRAILVDPFWEITPLLVLSSLFTRCITQPFETIGINFGLTLRAFFSHIPAQWQPIVLIILCAIILMCLIMTCGYRVSVPLMLSFQPNKQNEQAATRKSGPAVLKLPRTKAIKST